jgi:hypothetical protein
VIEVLAAASSVLTLALIIAGFVWLLIAAPRFAAGRSEEKPRQRPEVYAVPQPHTDEQSRRVALTHDGYTSGGW